MNTPITESSNDKSYNLDLASLNEAIDIFCSCEQEVFGNNYGKGVLDEHFLKNLFLLQHQISTLSSTQNELFIILVGAGTSGRICKMIADLFNIGSSGTTIIPLLSGGSDSLIHTQVNAEDSWANGSHDLSQIVNNINSSNTLVIGVSCGLSSSYVAGCLESALTLGCSGVAVLGFNPWEQKTMKFHDNDLAEKIIKINPIIGPEAISGSVRMKGGSATILILQSLFFPEDKKKTDIDTLESFFHIMKQKYTIFHQEIKKYSALFEKGAQTLRQGGNIFYLTKGDISYICLFDTVECYPTFGAQPGQINTFLENGIDFFSRHSYDNFKNNYSLDLEFFREKVTINDNDLLILAGIDDFLDQKLKSHNTMRLPSTNQDYNIDSLLFYRSLLSFFSSYSFTQAGKIYGNKMIDVKIANKKLYFRASRIVGDILHITEDIAQEKIIETINRYSHNHHIRNESLIEDIVKDASSIKNIVAKTILHFLYKDKTNKEIEDLIAQEPILRKLISHSLE